MKKLIIFHLLFCFSLLSTAQENYKKCITTRLTNNEILNNPEYSKGRATAIEKNRQWLAKNNKVESTISIPVVIHVIHRQSHSNIGTGTNISNEQIEDALRVLNEDYSKTNPEFPNPPRTTFLDYWGNPDIKFCLATTDPDGNATTGITRTSTIKNSFDADDNNDSEAMKRNSTGGNDTWDSKRYVNIWVCNLSNSLGGGETLGYAYLPSTWPSGHWKDGLVVDYQHFGTIDAASASDGRTPTHEIGHYLGLEHTFAEGSWWGPANSCGTSSNPICCDNDEGNVDDTPACLDIYFGPVNASTNNNSCNDLQYTNVFNIDVLDMDENYMSYSANTWMFSNGQVDVMHATLNTSRIELQNSTISTNCSGIISSSLNINSENISIYPNPNKGMLFFKSSINIQNIIITNIIGEIILSTNISSSNQIDISSLKNGVYFISINVGNATINKKIVLSK
tara:strand:+ start:9637 stop:10992 length:1356 start_codon:yes stop_codon:yes gene_type:complete